MSVNKSVSQKQIEEWAENPVTIAALESSRINLVGILKTPIPDCLVPNEPQQTQERIVRLDAMAHSWLEFTEVLTGDWEVFEELDELDDE